MLLDTNNNKININIQLTHYCSVTLLATLSELMIYF